MSFLHSNPSMTAHLIVKSKVLTAVSITWLHDLSHLITYDSLFLHNILPTLASLFFFTFVRHPPYQDLFTAVSQPGMLFPQTSTCSISHFPLLKCTFSVELTPAALFKSAIHLCWSPYSPFMAFVFYTAHTTIRITDLFHLLALSLNWLISSIRLEVCFSFWYELFTVISPVSKTVTGM